ncbi:MAG: type II toxin-antitoxin system Phd/YefM family antitoxin [Gammaproteobacteria bacterium]|nr:MAG: type II toxin-antitoxin system Phd/YefM family antitoxin [Gammaproteobacteria bacterium]
MTATYTYAKAKQRFDLILKKASLDGKVKIRKDDQLFIIMPEAKNVSPLDVEGVDIHITTKDIINLIHESRKG